MPAEEMRRKILGSGLVRKLEMPDPHLYFQAPGGQCLRLVGIDEDLSFYEGAGKARTWERQKRRSEECLPDRSAVAQGSSDGSGSGPGRLRASPSREEPNEH